MHTSETAQNAIFAKQSLKCQQTQSVWAAPLSVAPPCLRSLLNLLTLRCSRNAQMIKPMIDLDHNF